MQAFLKRKIIWKLKHLDLLWNIYFFFYPIFLFFTIFFIWFLPPLYIYFFFTFLYFTMDFWRRNSPEKKQKLRRLSCSWLCEAENEEREKSKKNPRFCSICDDFAIAFLSHFLSICVVLFFLVFFCGFLIYFWSRNSPETRKIKQ